MPLLKGRENVGHNIAEMEGAGHPRAQAIAAALRTARGSMAGGGVGGAQDKNAAKDAPGQINFMGGLIHSTVPGRTDKLNIRVPSDTYILPADVISAIGEGNTFAGASMLDRVFSGQPYNSPAAYRQLLGQLVVEKSAAPHLARGGAARGGMVPVVVAGGEYAVPPKIVSRLHGGDVDAGHDKLDNFVRGVREALTKVSQKLPGPKDAHQP